MLETTLIAFAGLLPIAGATHRLRGDAGASGDTARRLLRLGGAALLVLAFIATPGPLPGERVVRFLGGVSLAAIALVLLLSTRPRATLAPLRWLTRR